MSRDEKNWVAVNSLAGQNNPAIKAGWIGTKMPFADDSGVIATRLQMFGDVVSRSIEAIENRHAVEMRILPCQQGGPAGCANGIRHERVCKPCATAG